MVGSNPLTTSLLFLVGALYAPVAVNGRVLSVARADINSCLTGLNAIYPGDSAYTAESATFNARLSYQPAAIVHP